MELDIYIHRYTHNFLHHITLQWRDVFMYFMPQAIYFRKYVTRPTLFSTLGALVYNWLGQTS